MKNVHEAITIFSRITTEAEILMAHQTILLNALTTALTRIQVLEFTMPQNQPHHEQALATIQELKEANAMVNHDLTTLRTQAIFDALVIKALAVRAPENSSTSNSSGGPRAKISDSNKFDSTPEDLPSSQGNYGLTLVVISRCSLTNGSVSPSPSPCG